MYYLIFPPMACDRDTLVSTLEILFFFFFLRKRNLSSLLYPFCFRIILLPNYLFGRQLMAGPMEVEGTASGRPMPGGEQDTVFSSPSCAQKIPWDKRGLFFPLSLSPDWGRWRRMSRVFPVPRPGDGRRGQGQGGAGRHHPCIALT